MERCRHAPRAAHQLQLLESPSPPQPESVSAAALFAGIPSNSQPRAAAQAADLGPPSPLARGQGPCLQPQLHRLCCTECAAPHAKQSNDTSAPALMMQRHQPYESCASVHTRRSSSSRPARSHHSCLSQLRQQQRLQGQGSAKSIRGHAIGGVHALTAGAMPNAGCKQ